MHYGVYAKQGLEIIRTPRFVLAFYDGADTFGCRLYDGDTMSAVCERDKKGGMTYYAFLNSENVVVTNNGTLAGLLGAVFPSNMYNNDTSLVQFDDIVPIPVETIMPTVSEVGIADCLKRWKLGNQLNVFEDALSFTMNTNKFEYAMMLRQTSNDIYYGASVTIPYENGLLGGMQRFRIRNYQDNSAPFCAFYCNLTGNIEIPDIAFPEIPSKACISVKQGIASEVKRHTDDEIVLQGCGDDVYSYFRDLYMTERFAAKSKN